MIKHDFITHHGILGQRKGKRRFQYEDGSLTPEGRRRYLKGNGELTIAGKRRQEGAVQNSKKLIGEAGQVSGKYVYKTSKQNEEILSVAADKALKSLNRIEYLDRVTSDMDNKMSMKKRYAMARDADKLRLEYAKLVKDVTNTIVKENKTTRLSDFQNGDFSEYEKQVETLLYAIGKRRSEIANKIGL